MQTIEQQGSNETVWLMCGHRDLYSSIKDIYIALYQIEKSPNDSGQPNANNHYLNEARTRLFDASEKLTKLHFHRARRELLEAIELTKSAGSATTMANAVGAKVKEVWEMIDNRCST